MTWKQKGKKERKNKHYICNIHMCNNYIKIDCATF